MAECLISRGSGDLIIDPEKYHEQYAADLPYDEAAIRQRLKALREQDDRAAVELRQAYDALDEVLDIRQQARFRLFEEMKATGWIEEARAALATASPV